MKISAITLFGRLLLALVFIGAGGMKLFGNEMASPESLPGWVLWTQNPTLLIILAIVEVVLGILLLTRYWQAAILACTVLTTVFAGYLFLLAVAGVDLRICSCFGPREITPASHFLLLGGMFAVCVATSILAKTNLDKGHS